MPFDGLSDDQLRQQAPSIFATHPAPNTSPRYAYLPSYTVVREMRNMGFVPMSAGECRKKNPQGRAFAMHQITFRQRDYYSRAPELGELTPELHLLNSHDTTSPLAIDVAMMRAICTNGARTNDETYGAFKVRHTGRDKIEQLHAGMAKILESLDRMVEVANDWNKIQLTPFQAAQFASQALDIKGTRLSVDPLSVLKARRYADQGMSLWNVYNRVQENLFKGGLNGVTASGKPATLRKISTLVADVDFNRKLWTAAAKVADEAESRPVPSGVVASA